MFRTLVTVIVFITLTTTSLDAHAQSNSRQPSRWAFLMSSGALIPTGAQREAVSSGALSAAQLSYAVRPALALNATLGWARSRDRVLDARSKVDVFTYDLGAELRGPRWFAAHAVTFSPFAGAGAGARSQNYRQRDIGTAHSLAAYGSVGGEFGAGRVRVRVEARDNIAALTPLNAQGGSNYRNDVALMAGLRIIRR